MDKDAQTAAESKLPRWLRDYRPPSSGYDELLTDDGQVRPDWQPFVDGLHAIGAGGVGERAEHARRLLRENGVTYNNVGAPLGPDRPWELDPLPLIFGPSQWSVLADGLKQRLQLLNLLLADIYGPQRTLKEGILPAEVVFSNANYWLPCSKIAPPGAHVVLHACNLARQTDGSWMVLADRTQGPSGAGYALENRIVISRTLPRNFESLHIERLASFFLALRETLRRLATERKDNPRVVLLSPGSRSSRYFEDGYLARYLGYALVEGGDLTVRGESVYLKTLGGLVPVDVILRRVLDGDCDPLELNGESYEGTPGLLQAVRGGQLAVANAIGSGFVEAPVISAFLPRLCRYFLSEDLKLQSKPTWWLGDTRLDQFSNRAPEELIVRRAFNHREENPIYLCELSAGERKALWERVAHAPANFVVQERIARSTAPMWAGGQMVPARLVLRGFTLAPNGDVDQYKVLPGGLCRVAEKSHEVDESAASGQSSKDVWVLSAGPVEPVTLLRGSSTALELRRSTNDVSSRTADNLYWLGRYAERSEALVRHLRSCLVRLTNELEPSGSKEIMCLLLALDDHPAYCAEEAMIENTLLESSADVVTQWIFDETLPGSLAQMLRGFHGAANQTRDRLSVDCWRIVNQLDLELLSSRQHQPLQTGDMLLLLNQMINLFAAFGGLSTESMTRGPGWRFLDMGRRIERALQILTLCRRMLAHAVEPLTPILEAILEIADSSMTYRYRYLASLQLAPLLDLVLIDETNPRAVGFQLNALSDHVTELPADPQQAHRSPEQRIMLGMQATLRLTDVEAFVEANGAGRRERLEKFLASLEEQLKQLSSSLSHRYLTHTAHTRQLGAARLGD